MSKPLLSRVRRAGNILYLSGMIGRGEDKETKFRDTFERIKGVLEENGLAMENVVKAIVYLEDIDDRPKYLNPRWREYFAGIPPTRTCVEARLNGGLLEITVTAAIPDYDSHGSFLSSRIFTSPCGTPSPACGRVGFGTDLTARAFSIEPVCRHRYPV